MTCKTKQFWLMNLGCIIYALGDVLFKIPNKFTTGGVSGVGTLISGLTEISAGVWVWSLNLLLIIAGFWFLGGSIGIKTVYCTLIYSFALFMFEQLFQINAPLTDQPFMELCCGVFLNAVGAATVFYCGGSTGGTDIVAMILKKFVHIDIGKAIFAADFFIVASSFFVFDTLAGLCSVFGLFVKAFVTDAVLDNFEDCKYFVVITNKGEIISKHIIKTLGRGVTSHSVVGEYTGEGRVMLHTVCKRAEAAKLKLWIKDIDPSAFVIIAANNEIIGNGFVNI